MATRERSDQTDGRLDIGWYLLACAVFAALLVAEYLGPLIAIAFSVLVVGLAVVLIRNYPIPQLPPACLWLIGIVVLGLSSAVIENALGHTVHTIDLQRDIGITVSYVLFMTLGLFFAYTRMTLRLILATIAAAGLVISIVQLVKLTVVLSSGVNDLYLLRLDAGRGSATQFAALCACLVLLRDPAAQRYRIPIITAAAISAFSTLTTLSRGLMIDLIIVVIVVVGLTANRSGRLIPELWKFVVGVASAAALVIGTYVALRIVLPPVGHFIDEFFITKLMNSVNEVASTDMETREQIATNYRAFELTSVTKQFEAQPFWTQWLGQGWGTTVEYGFETASTRSTFSRTSAPFLHNGYAYYLMKVGIVGLVLYIAFMCQVATKAISKKTWPSSEFALIRRKILLAAVIVLAIDTTTSGGFGFPATYLAVAAVLGACYCPVWGPAGEEEKTSQAPDLRANLPLNA
jgi:hypothetical protein